MRISAHCVDRLDTAQASLCIVWAVGMARVRNSYDGTPVDAVSTIATAEGGGSTNRGHVLILVPIQPFAATTFEIHAEVHPPLQLSNMTTPAIGLGTIARTDLLFRASDVRGTHRAVLSPQSGSCITARCRSGREPLGERWIGLLHATPIDHLQHVPVLYLQFGLPVATTRYIRVLSPGHDPQLCCVRRISQRYNVPCAQHSLCYATGARPLDTLQHQRRDRHGAAVSPITRPNSDIKCGPRSTEQRGAGVLTLKKKYGLL